MDVSAWRALSEEGRYRKLVEELRGDARDGAEMARRAHLVTALREAKLYPEKSYAVRE